ncbi:MAG: hypothetical protein EZS28_049434, partial [Streblomastix strix]
MRGVKCFENIPPAATKKLQSKQPEQSGGEELESDAEAIIIKIAARVAEMIKKQNAIELQNALKVENERISALRVHITSSSIQPAAQAQGHQVNQNKVAFYNKIFPIAKKDSSEKRKSQIVLFQTKLELIKMKEAFDILIESSMIKLLADIVQVEKGSFNPLKNRNYSQKIRGKIKVHDSDKDIVDGVTSSKEVLSDDSRQKIEEKEQVNLLER